VVVVVVSANHAIQQQPPVMMMLMSTPVVGPFSPPRSAPSRAHNCTVTIVEHSSNTPDERHRTWSFALYCIVVRCETRNDDITAKLTSTKVARDHLGTRIRSLSTCLARNRRRTLPLSGLLL
jgi:hypothetical protein